MGLSVPASLRVPCQSEPVGKPRLTLVSDGNPFRRLLLCSTKNSASMAVSPWMDLPVTSRRGNCLADISLSARASRCTCPELVGFGQLLKHRDYTHLPITHERLRFEANRKNPKFECNRLISSTIAIARRNGLRGGFG